MKLNVRSWLAGVALASALALAACGGGGGGGTGSSGGGGNALDVTTQGEQLAYNPATLSAAANQQVTVNFKNGSASQKHNWVLVKGGDDVASKVDEAAAANGGEAAVGGDVVAATKLLDGNASGSAQFSLPAGSYTYLCTFPGHYLAGMKGTLTVK